MTEHSNSILRASAVKMYFDGVSMQIVADSVGYSTAQVSRWVRDAGFKARLDRKKGNVFDENTFSVIDSEKKAYVLGLLATDGCIFAPRGMMKNPLIILKSKDRFIVEVFAEVCGSQAVRMSRTNGDDYYRCALPSKKMADDLAKLGLHSGKTYNLSDVNYPDEFAIPFWRGAVDGDGCLSFDHSPYLSLCGTKEFCIQFIEFCSTLGLKAYLGTYKESLVNPGWQLHRGTLRGDNARELARVLYASDVAVPRKLQVARGWCI
jgi:hypothetical protein